MLDRITRIISTRNISVLACVALILAATLGCSKISELVKKRSENTPPANNSSQIDTETDAGDSDTRENDLVKKTNFYITGCFNKYSNSVVQSHNRYRMWVKDMAVGPTGKEMNIYGLYEVSGDGSDCEKAIADASAIDPELPEIEEAADAYVVALKDVIMNINGIYKYYEQGDYKDDAFAKGKEAHPALVESFAKFKEINATFAVEVDKLEDQVAQSQLEKLEGQTDKRYEYLVVESGIKAKRVKTLIQEKDDDQITADEMNTLITDFESTVDELRKAETNAIPGTSYSGACDDFTKAAKEMMRRIRDGKKFSNIEKNFIATGAGWMVEGSADKVIKAYNDMISRRRILR